MKYITAIALSLTLALTLTACTTAQATKSGDESNLTVENESIIEGKITRVDGNEIKIDVGTIKTSERQGMGGASNESSKGEGSTEVPSDDSEGGAVAGSRASGAGDAGTGSRPDGAASRPSGDASTGGMPSLATTSIELTGESKTLEVPVGTPVYVTVRGESSTVNFTRLSKDNLVKINMNDEDKVLSITVVS